MKVKNLTVNQITDIIINSTPKIKTFGGRVFFYKNKEFKLNDLVKVIQKKDLSLEDKKSIFELVKRIRILNQQGDELLKDKTKTSSIQRLFTKIKQRWGNKIFNRDLIINQILNKASAGRIVKKVLNNEIKLYEIPNLINERMDVNKIIRELPVLIDLLKQEDRAILIDIAKKCAYHYSYGKKFVESLSEFQLTQSERILIAREFPFFTFLNFFYEWNIDWKTDEGKYFLVERLKEDPKNFPLIIDYLKYIEYLEFRIEFPIDWSSDIGQEILLSLLNEGNYGVFFDNYKTFRLNDEKINEIFKEIIKIKNEKFNLINFFLPYDEDNLFERSSSFKEARVILKSFIIGMLKPTDVENIITLYSELDEFQIDLSMENDRDLVKSLINKTNSLNPFLNLLFSKKNTIHADVFLEMFKGLVNKFTDDFFRDFETSFKELDRYTKVKLGKYILFNFENQIPGNLREILGFKNNHKAWINFLKKCAKENQLIIARNLHNLQIIQDFNYQDNFDNAVNDFVSERIKIINEIFDIPDSLFQSFNYDVLSIEGTPAWIVLPSDPTRLKQLISLFDAEALIKYWIIAKRFNSISANLILKEFLSINRSNYKGNSILVYLANTPEILFELIKQVRDDIEVLDTRGVFKTEIILGKFLKNCPNLKTLKIDKTLFFYSNQETLPDGLISYDFFGCNNLNIKDLPKTLIKLTLGILNKATSSYSDLPPGIETLDLGENTLEETEIEELPRNLHKLIVKDGKATDETIIRLRSKGIEVKIISTQNIQI